MLLHSFVYMFYTAIQAVPLYTTSLDTPDPSGSQGYTA
jgi:hypothetical protein